MVVFEEEEISECLDKCIRLWIELVMFLFIVCVKLVMRGLVECFLLDCEVVLVVLVVIIIIIVLLVFNKVLLIWEIRVKVG